MKKDYEYNYYVYYLINLNTQSIVKESDDLDYIKQLKKEITGKCGKYAIQQQHVVARIIG